MARQALARSPALRSLLRVNTRATETTAWRARSTSFQPTLANARTFTSTRWTLEEQKEKSDAQSPAETPRPGNPSMPPGWEDDAELAKISRFSDLPHEHFGHNQHIKINEDFKEDLRQVLWQFRAPIRYAFAYGSGVFGQSNTTGGGADGMSPHPNPSKAVQEWQSGGAKIIDFIFGVSHTQHWHSLNMAQYPEHYSGLKYLPYASAAISKVQDSIGAGVYFNPYITVNGTMIKYGVVNLDTLSSDLSEWNTLYLAGRLQKPVKILRDDPRVRLANQVNLISALRTALLMLPENFTERQLYERIAGLSYMGDPRMNSYFSGENPDKVSNIVGAQLPGFRQLYVPLITTLPNLSFTDSRTPHVLGWEKEDAIRHTGSSPALHDVLGGENGLQLQQDMDPQKRGNMVRRLPKAFRTKLYWQYKKQFGIPGSAFDSVLEAAADEDSKAAYKKRDGGDFERKIAAQENLSAVMVKTVTQTVAWPSTSQTIKSFFTAGIVRAWRYYSDKRRKSKEKAKKDALKKLESGEKTE